MEKNIKGIVAGALIAIVLIAVIVVIQTGDADEDIIKVGAIHALTGPLSEAGKSEQSGLILAAEHINRDDILGGKKIRMVFEDSQAQASLGLAAAQRLLDIEGTRILFTSFTNVSLAIKPIIADYNACQIVFAMDEAIPKDNENVFRIYPGIVEEGNKILEYIQGKNPERVAVVHFQQAAFENQVYNVLEPGFKKMGLDSYMIERFERVEDGLIRSIAAKFRRFEPDQIVVNAFYNQIPAILKVFGEMGLLNNTEIIGGLNLVYAIVDTDIVPHEISEGVIVARPVVMRGIEGREFQKKTEDFVRQYKERFGKSPSHDAAYAYDALTLLAAIIGKVGSDTNDIIRELHRTRDFHGVVGPLTIDGQGNSITNWELLVNRDGELQSLTE